MLFLTAYFDESGHAKDPNLHFTGIAGLVAPAAIWEEVEAEWNQVINRPEFALTEAFHMKHFAHGQGQFKGWDKTRKNDLHKALIAVIVKAEAIPTGCIVSNSAFNSLSQRQQRMFRSPYVTAFQRGVHGAALKGMMLEGENEKVAMIFARQEDYGTVEAKGEDNPDQAGNTENLFYWMKRRTDFGDLLGAYGSSTPEEMIPLQVADMLAYELTKEFETLVSCPTRPMRLSLRELLRAGGDQPLISYLDRIELLRIVKNSNFPDKEGTEEIDENSIQQIFAQRAAQDILFVRRERTERQRFYEPKWLIREFQRRDEENSLGAKGRATETPRS